MWIMEVCSWGKLCLVLLEKEGKGLFRVSANICRGGESGISFSDFLGYGRNLYFCFFFWVFSSICS